MKSIIFVIFNVHFFHSLACLNNNKTGTFQKVYDVSKDNISKSIYDEDPSYVPSDNSSDQSDESFLESVIDQATNFVAKQTDSSENTSNRLHISSILDVSDRGI